jgi:hypothetical protein
LGKIDVSPLVKRADGGSITRKGDDFEPIFTESEGIRKEVSGFAFPGPHGKRAREGVGSERESL